MKDSIPKISIIIPNLNGIRYLPACLGSIQSQVFREFEVIVIDNGSTDGSVGFIRAHFPETVIIENKRNLGFAKANNQGIEIARSAYIATLNNDTEVDSEWLKHLYSAVKSSDSSVGMWAPKILSLEENDRIDSVGGLLLYPDGIARGRGRLEKDMGQYDNVRDILLPSACSALYRRDMLDEVGGFDDDFFAYCEDTDLGLRARLAGWRAVSVPESVVYHHYSGTGGEYSETKAFLVERNHIWVALKNFPMSWICQLPFYIVLRYIFQFYGVASGKGSAAKFRKSHSVIHIIFTIMKAYVSSVKGLPCVIKKRKTVKKKITDKQYKHILHENGISARKLALQD